MANRDKTPPVGPAGGANKRAQESQGSPPDFLAATSQSDTAITALPVDLQRLVAAASPEQKFIIGWVHDLIEFDIWRAENGQRLSSEASARCAWASDVARLLVALIPAADRIDLMSKSMVILQYDAVHPMHVHLRRLLEYALRLDLERIDFPANDTFARNLSATLDRFATRTP